MELHSNDYASNRLQLALYIAITVYRLQDEIKDPIEFAAKVSEISLVSGENST